MAAAVAQYTHAHFQGLPDLSTARANFENQKAAEVIEKFKDLFVSEKMDRVFGLALLHRHFDLEPHQKLVEYRSTSVPWEPMPGLENLEPVVWSFSDQAALRPTEFRWSNEKPLIIGDKETVFIDKFMNMLREHKMLDLFGLSRYPGDDFPGSCEFTSGKANINLHPDDYPRNLIALDTVWYFSEPLWTRGCRCTCNASAKDHPHGTHVITMSG